MVEVAPNSYENLTHSRMLTAYAKDNKEVSLTCGVYNGNTSLSVFNGAGGRPVWSLNIARPVWHQIGELLKLMMTNPTQCRHPIIINEWDAEARRFNQVAQVAFGIDETNNVCIDIASDKAQGGPIRFIFVIKPAAKFDFSNTPLNEKNHIVATLSFLRDLFLTRTAQAEIATSFKRQPGGPGGNRGGGGGNWNNNRGGGNGGGGGGWNNNRGQNQGGGNGGGGFNTGNGNSSVTIDDGDIPI